MDLSLNKIDLDKTKPIIEKVNINSEDINNFVNNIVSQYCSDLDTLVTNIKNILFSQTDDPMSDEELDSSIMKLSSILYFVSEKQEELGIKEDISKSFYNETYNTTRNSLTTGTVSDKDSYAKLQSQQELLTNMIFNRCYKKIKSKIESAYELLTSMKKVLSRRISALDLSKVDKDRYNARERNENS